MQFKVPQNISLEDKIAGPLTLIQFIICVVGCGIAFIIFNITSINPLNKILAGGMVLLTAFIAVGKFNDQPMYKFFRYIILFIMTPRIRVWHKNYQQVRLITENTQRSDKDTRHVTKNISRQDIARLAVVLDSRGTMGSTPKTQPPKKEK
jgi:hypothetical protein